MSIEWLNSFNTRQLSNGWYLRKEIVYTTCSAFDCQNCSIPPFVTILSKTRRSFNKNNEFMIFLAFIYLANIHLYISLSRIGVIKLQDYRAPTRSQCTELFSMVLILFFE